MHNNDATQQRGRGGNSDRIFGRNFSNRLQKLQVQSGALRERCWPCEALQNSRSSHVKRLSGFYEGGRLSFGNTQPGFDRSHVRGCLHFNTEVCILTQNTWWWDNKAVPFPECGEYETVHNELLSITCILEKIILSFRLPILLLLFFIILVLWWRDRNVSRQYWFRLTVYPTQREKRLNVTLADI